MRIWGLTDPNHLCRKHLLGEHNEFHVLYKGGWKNHPEYKRFEEVPDGQSWLAFRHELLRIEMNRRWHDNHSKDNHATPIERCDIDSLCRDAQEFLALYESGKFSHHPHEFTEAMLSINFPEKKLEHDTPWHRDLVPFEWYIEHRDDWSWQLVNDYHGYEPAEGKYHGSK